MAFRITPAHDASKQIEFEIPREDGTILTFSVRKLHYFSPDTQSEYNEWFEKQVKAKKATDRACTLKLLEMLVPEHYEELSKLTNGELAEISKYWEEQSRVNLGESEPSQDS